MITYRHLATSIGGFVQQLAVAYIARGYFYYSTAIVPSGKDPYAVDAKLLQRYDIAISKWERARRKRAGVASVQYLRFDRLIVIVATKGAHRFFEDEEVRDFRRRPLYFAGYSIGAKMDRDGAKWHPHVRLAMRQYLGLKSWLLEAGGRRGVAEVGAMFAALDVEAYAPVRRQLLTLRKKVNEERCARGLEAVPVSYLPLRRRALRPFD